jgi:hypothetical protein
VHGLVIVKKYLYIYRYINKNSAPCFLRNCDQVLVSFYIEVMTSCFSPGPKSTELRYVVYYGLYGSGNSKGSEGVPKKY